MPQATKMSHKQRDLSNEKLRQRDELPLSQASFTFPVVGLNHQGLRSSDHVEFVRAPRGNLYSYSASDNHLIDVASSYKNDTSNDIWVQRTDINIAKQNSEVAAYQSNNSNNHKKQPPPPLGIKPWTAKSAVTSPRPFIPPKPRRYSEGSTKDANLRPPGVKRVSAPIHKSLKPFLVSQEAQANSSVPNRGITSPNYVTKSSTLPRKLKTNQNNNIVAENYLCGVTGSLKRNKSVEKGNQQIAMDSPQIKPALYKIDPRKTPPKIATKPKDRNVSKDNENLNKTVQETAVPNPSDIRNKFEGMKMKFKKPVEDKVFTPSQNNFNDTNGPITQTASELFKDILEMKDLDGFIDTLDIQPGNNFNQQSPTIESKISDDTGSNSSEPTGNGNYEYINDTWSLDFEKQPTKVEPSQNLKHLKTKFENEFESKVINSLISPTEKKKFFQQLPPPRPQRSSSLDENRKKSLHGELHHQNFPPPPKPINYGQTLNFDDLPAPPNLPPAHPNTNMSLTPVSHHSRRSDVKSGVNLSEGVQLSSADQPAVHDQYCNKDTSQDFQSANPVPKVRNFEEEILYYDNMDIMEKVRQKEERENQKQAEILSNSQSISKPKNLTPEAHQNVSKNEVKSSKNIEQQSVINNQRPNDTKSITSEFQSAMGDLEYEYLKLKANLDQQTVSARPDPPKLPPKQRKFKRESETADDNSHKQDNNVQAKPNQLKSLGLKLNIPSQQVQLSNHVSTPMPTESNAPVFKPTNNQLPPMPVIPQVTPEEMRARTLVDEPLAPIMEEDSQYGDSSSCASSVADEAIIVDDQSSIKSLQSKGRTDSISSLNSSRKETGIEDSELDLLDGETTETDTPEVFLSSSTTIDSGSDAASLKWNSHPLMSHSNSTKPPDNNAITERPTSRGPSAAKEGVYDFLSDEETASNKSYNPRHSFKREISRDSRSSISSHTSGKESRRSPEIGNPEESEQKQHENETLLQQQRQRYQEQQQQHEKLKQQQQQLQKQQEQQQQMKQQQQQLQKQQEQQQQMKQQQQQLQKHQEQQQQIKQQQQQLQKHQEQQQQIKQQKQQIQKYQEQQRAMRQQEQSQQKQQQQKQQHEKQEPYEEIIHDVEPYGMVDLTNLDHTFEDSARYESCDDPDDLTPSGIMTEVNVFNTLPKQPKSFAQSSVLDDNLPNFPMDIDVNRSNGKPGSGNSHNQFAFNQFEEVGYDNLENYGGAARKAAEDAKELKTKYAQSTKKKQERSHSFNNKLIHKGYKSHGGLSDSRSPRKNKQETDPLGSVEGLEQQGARSRSSFPLPVSAEHLSRHSSAVSALDRHSGNLKRNKTEPRLQSKAKSPSERRIHTQEKEKQPSTLPRTHAEKESEHTNDDAHLKERTTPNRSKSQEEVAGKNSVPLDGHSGLERQQSTENFQPFPVGRADYDESLDDGVINPYEEVPFLIDAPLTHLKPDTKEQKEAKHRVREILENIKPPESPYKPKPPLPRYPVEYDNFYLGDSKSRASSGIGSDEANRSKLESGATSSTSPPPSPTAEERTKTSGYSDSTPAESRTRTSSTRSDVANTTSTDTPSATPSAKRRSKETPRRKSRDNNAGDSSDAAANSKSLGSQLRSLLGSTPESKYISPSLRRKRSLLKRSKSPGGSSRRAKSPARVKEEENSKSKQESQDKEDENKDIKEDTQSIKSVPESHQEEEPKKRSASQRIVDRRGRAPRSSFRKSKASGDESTDTLERKTKSRMWRRSKSTDRESPTRSKSKERKLGGFGRRSKSSERPNPHLENKGEIDIGERGRSTRSSFFRRSRSSSRKRDGGKSSERNKDKEEGGRNPVNFFKKLLRNKKEDEDGDEIIHLPLGKGVDLSDSSEALSTILAYKGDEVVEPGRWTPPRPNPPQQQTPSSTSKKGKSNKTKNKSSKSNKPMRSPPSHRAKKVLSSRSQQAERSTGSSSEGNLKPSEAYGNMGSNRSFLSPQKPSRKSSFSNSVPSSDSDSRSISRSKENILLLNGAKNRLLQQQKLHEQNRSPSLRRNVLANREYDSDTTSVMPSDPDSSNGVQSDVEAVTPRSAMKQPGGSSRMKGHLKTSTAPRRPVRVVSGGRSKSDPSLFVEEGEQDPKNTYYNIDDDGTSKLPSSPTTQEKKRQAKIAANRRRSQKQNRRQTSPVDMAFATHQRQKYRTLVSLNAQTLRKVTERWLSEWRNNLPVGGFLITSWSDIGLSSHRALCMIGNSVVYGAVPTGNNKFNLACQLYDQRDVDDRMSRKLEDCASLPAHPNTCGVCSHFSCRVPRSLLDPSSRGGAADAVCVVLSSRPQQSLQEHLDDVVLKEDPTEYHRQLLVCVLQLLQGIKHLISSGFDLQTISSEHLIVAEKTGFLQILPHLQWTSGKSRRSDAVDSSDSDSASLRATKPQQISRLVKRLLHNGTLQTLAGGLGGPGDRSSAASSVSRVVVPGTKYSPAIKRVIRHLENPQVTIQESTELVQCSLWGPENIDDVGVDDVTPYAALELWLEMEQAKLVNSLAVLMPEDRLSPSSLLKHQYFATVGPDVLFTALKTLQRI